MSQLEATKRELEQKRQDLLRSIREDEEKTLDEILLLAKNFFEGRSYTEISYSLLKSMLRNAFVSGKIAHSACKIKLEAWEIQKRNTLSSLLKETYPQPGK